MTNKHHNTYHKLQEASDCEIFYKRCSRLNSLCGVSVKAEYSYHILINRIYRTKDQQNNLQIRRTFHMTVTLTCMKN